MNAAEKLADEEVERQMNETPDEEEAAEEETPEPEPEPEPQPVPDPGLTEQQAEREFKRLESAAQRYLKTAMPITVTLGMPVELCPLCAPFPGLAFQRAAHEVTSDIERAVDRLIGREALPSLKSSDGYRICDVCDGWGEVLTGARKPISRAAVCPNPNCGGKGYVQVPISVPPPAPVVPFPGAGQPFQPLPQGIPDQWGRPAGHPQWGIDPATIGV